MSPRWFPAARTRPTLSTAYIPPPLTDDAIQPPIMPQFTGGGLDCPISARNRTPRLRRLIREMRRWDSVRVQSLLSQIDSDQRSAGASGPDADVLDAYSQAVVNAVEAGGGAAFTVGIGPTAPVARRARGMPGIPGAVDA